METAQHWDKLAKNQPAEITMFQISEVQESPAFNGRRSFLTLRARWEDMPTQYYIVNAIADLEVSEFVGSSMTKTVGGKDRSDQRILR